MNATVGLETPIGWLAIHAGEDGLTRVEFAEGPVPESGRGRARQIAGQAARELREYFEGTRRAFDTPLAPSGTAFQRAVWGRVRAIPWGATVTYGEIARALGDERKVRAVGAANGANPLPIFIPCHRVVGADGSLTGYAGGLERKAWLLAHESRQKSLPDMHAPRDIRRT
ncbi:MAG: methylated-DNA--[protein]-cysteine S-methyltransferase [Acidobacteriota bacterium]